MSNKETFSGELAKKIPVDKVYDDVLQPALSEVGNTLKGAVRVSLAPISALVWGYEKIASYLDEAIPKYFEDRKISKEKIKTPEPAIAIPAIEALRYVNEELLRQMYVDILGASMNTDTANFIHPSFVIIINQLTSDEAKIIKRLPYKGLYEPLVNICIQKPNTNGTFVKYRNCGVLGEEAECIFPEKLSLYTDNLQRLALVEVPENNYLVDKWRYDKVFNSEYINLLMKEAEKEGDPFFERKMIGLTDYGMQLREICLQDCL